MKFSVDRGSFVKRLDIVRDDRGAKGRLNAEEIPYIAITAWADGRLEITGLSAEVSMSADVARPGRLFIRAARFRQLIASLTTTKSLTVEATSEALVFADTRLRADAADWLAYGDPAGAPTHHPHDRSRARQMDETLYDAALRARDEALDRLRMAATEVAGAENALAEMMDRKPDVPTLLREAMDAASAKGRRKRASKKRG